MGAVTDEVLHDNVGRVRLEGDAVVTVVDVRVLDHDVAAAVRVPAVSVLGWVRGRAAAEDVDVREDDICGVGNQRVPLRAVAELQVLDSGALQADGAEEDWTKDVNVLGVEIVPGLAVAIKSSATIYIDILATKLEESGGVLEGLIERILLPVVGVVGELDHSLNV